MFAIRFLKVAALLAAATRLMGTASAYPSSYDFRYGNLTGNSTTNASTGAQYRFELIDTGAGTVGFRFSNAGPIASSITDIYFQASPSTKGLLAGLASIVDSGAKVNFQAGARTKSLGGSAAGVPDFLVDSKLSAYSRGASPGNGVNPGSEWVQLVFNLRRGVTFADVQAAVDRAYNDASAIWKADGSVQRGAADGIRVGIRVQGFETGKPESFVARAGLLVPEPSAFATASLSGLLLLLHARRRRRSLV